MRSILGFLGMVILFIEMVNHAHADTGREDAEGLRAGVMIASKAESSSLGLAHRDSTQGDGEIKAVAEGADNTGVIDSSQVEHIRALADSGYAESGLQAMPDSLSVRTARGDDRGTDKRVALKLGAGGLVGTVAGSALALFLYSNANLDQESDGIGSAGPIIYGWVIGNIAGTSIGVTLVDPHDRFIMALTGSSVGMWLGSKATPDIYGRGWYDMWPVFVCPVVGATIMSELWRKPPESRRFSIGLVPSLGGNLAAVVTLRF